MVIEAEVTLAIKVTRGAGSTAGEKGVVRVQISGD